MSSFVRISIITTVVITSLLLLIGFFVVLQVPFVLVFGWISFLLRVIPQISIDVGEVAVAATALLGFTAGLHYFLRSFMTSRKTSNHDGEPVFVGNGLPTWHWSKSIAVVVLVCLLFCSGVAAVGITHQTIWLSQSRIYESDFLGTVQRTDSANRVRQIALATHNFHDRYKQLPEGSTRARNGGLLHGWMTSILPYIEAGDVYEMIDHQLPWNHAVNQEPLSTRIPDFETPFVGDRPADYHITPYGRADYASNRLVIGPGPAMKLEKISDGTSRTLFIGEVISNQRPWGHPANWRDPNLGLNRSTEGFSSPWKTGVNFAFCDGSVQVISDNIDPELLKALSTPAANDDATGDW